MSSCGCWQHDTTPDGHEVMATQDPYLNAHHDVYLDGARVDIYKRRRLRDGGTTILDTSAGRITFHRRLRQPQRITFQPAVKED